jgi:hypothetical protein
MGKWVLALVALQRNQKQAVFFEADVSIQFTLFSSFNERL